MTIQDFKAKWSGATLKERSASQEHFIDLCRALGTQTPAEADSAGAFYTFERGVAKTGGGLERVRLGSIFGGSMIGPKFPLWSNGGFQ